MPLRFDSAKLRRAAKSVAGLVTSGTPQRKRMTGAIVVAVKALTREQFAKGIDPSGAPQSPKKQGSGPGLKSEKLSRGAVAIEAHGDVVRGCAKNPKWSSKLDAHQEGHTFKGRSGVQRRDARGRLISKSTFRKRVAGAEAQAWANTSGSYGYAKKGKRGAFGRVRASIQRTRGGVRVLPSRPIYPRGGSQLTARWENRIGLEVAKSIAGMLGKAAK